MSFTHPDFPALHPSVALSWASSPPLHFLTSKSLHPFPRTTLPAFISSCFQMSASASVAVLAMEGCTLSGLCALAASPSKQQSLLLLNVTVPLLLQLSNVRVTAQCRKISWWLITLSSALKLKQQKPHRENTDLHYFGVLPFFCKSITRKQHHG